MADAVPALFAIIFFFKNDVDRWQPQPYFDYHQKFLFSKISRNSIPIFVMWHNADADSALNFPKWIIQNNFIFNKLTDDSPSPYKKLALKFHPQRCSDSWKSSSLPWCADAASAPFKDSSANYVICHHFQSGFFKKQSKAFLSNLVAV